MPKLENTPARGTRDFLPAEEARREAVISAISSSYGRFGFRRIETPAIESIERLTAGQGGENEKLIYRILKRGLPSELEAGTPLDELTDLALRYDLTVPLTRFYANNKGRIGAPFRSLQIGPVWRAERPAKGRYRQFTQCDVDVIGEASVLAECELLEATLRTLEELGMEEMTVRLNDRRILTAVAASVGVETGAIGSYFVTLDKRDRIGWEGVAAELDEKGFTKEVAISSERLLGGRNWADDPGEVISYLADSLPGLDEAVLIDLSSTAQFLTALTSRMGSASLVIDPTVVRGMGYYTGQIFEIARGEGSQSIGGGGRYDDLLGRWLGEPVPACGFSIGFERVVDLAQMEPADFGVALLYGSEEPSRVLTAARELRDSGRPVTLFPRRKSLRAQLGALYEAGYRAFATLDGERPGEVRPLSGEES